MTNNLIQTIKTPFPAMRHFFIAIAAVIMVCNASQASEPEPFWLGADISATTELEHRGIHSYNADGVQVENTQLMKDLGLNAIRLRVWVNPIQRWSNPTDVLVMALRAKELGMELMIDFHYSDWWADPGKQYIPKAWADMPMDELKKAVADHTRSTLQLLKDYGVDVRWVQVGNETSNGMMWPAGHAADHMDQYAALFASGYDAVKEVYPEAVVIVHLDNGYDSNLYNWNLDGLRDGGARWDMIGMSLYPYWTIREHLDYTEQMLIDMTVDNINALYDKYSTPLMIVETGYESARPEEGKAFIGALIDAVATRTGGHCNGVWYWAPETSEQAYPLGAFSNNRPTVIMDAFTEAARKYNHFK